jgi:hypothetical protein
MADSPSVEDAERPLDDGLAGILRPSRQPTCCLVFMRYSAPLRGNAMGIGDDAW